MRPINKPLFATDFDTAEEVQLSAENDPPRIRRAVTVGICLLVAGVIAIAGWLA